MEIFGLEQPVMFNGLHIHIPQRPHYLKYISYRNWNKHSSALKCTVCQVSIGIHAKNHQPKTICSLQQSNHAPEPEFHSTTVCMGRSYNSLLVVTQQY